MGGVCGNMVYMPIQVRHGCHLVINMILTLKRFLAYANEAQCFVLLGASLKDIQSFFVKHSAMSDISFKM